MTYSPECVAAFEAKFPPDHGVTFNAKINAYESESAINESQAILSTDQLEAFAANWQRVRELEEALEFVAADHQDKSARDLARKLLEKGNE